MLAAISDYFFWWQGVILAVFVMLWLFGGWPLLWVGGRFLARAGRATLGMSLLARLLAGAVGFSVTVLLPVGLGAALGPAGAVAGVLLGLPAGLLLGWLMIKAVFATSYGRAILAWLPTLVVWVIAMPLWITLLMPSLRQARGMAKRSVCATNLNAVAKAALVYAYANDDQWPADLGVLVQLGRVGPRRLKCPGATSGRRDDYFYLPAGPDDPDQRIVACDYRENHGGEGRNVLFKSGVVAWMGEAEFQAALAQPHNAEFAKALRAADRPRPRPKRSGRL